jgi:TonB family protein
MNYLTQTHGKRTRLSSVRLVRFLGIGLLVATGTDQARAAANPSTGARLTTVQNSDASGPNSNSRDDAGPSPTDTSLGDSGISPPRPLHTTVDTPEEPRHRVVVLLELLIDAEGHVEQARLLDGPEPFARAAVEAAARFSFEPARQRGRTTAARIRFLVRFEPKELIATPPAPTSQTQRAGKNSLPPTATGTAPLEVVVTAMRPAYTTGTITRSEAREIPGTFGDPLRAIESSTGVTPIFSGVPFFFVRGAPPGNVGFFLDGIRVPLLYHAVLGPSVIHPALIDHVELNRGAAPPRFGRYAGAIVSAETRPPLERMGGEANVRVFDAGALVETPFANGRGHALVGGRYSYTGLLVSLLSAAKLQYWDYQTRVDYATSRHGRIGIFAFGAYDHFAAQDGTVERGGGLQFHRVDLRYDIDEARTKTRIAFTTGYDRTGSPSGALKDQLFAVRGLTQHRLHQNVSLSYGSDVMVDRFALQIDRATAEAPDIDALFPNRTDVQGSVFTELNYTPTEWIALAPGLRVDAYRIAGSTATAVDPRFSTTLRPNRTLYTAYTIGVGNQPPNFVPQVPAATIGTLKGGLQRAFSMSTTVGANLPYDFGVAVTGFRAEYYNLLDPIGRDKDWSFDRNNLSHRERGMAYGVELEVRRSMTRRIGGFLSGTFSHTERSSGDRESLSAFDRPIVLSAALGFELGYRIRAGARLAYYSGIPGHVFGDKGPRFEGSMRSSPYYRADLRLERRWPIAGRGYWAVVAEMLNATMSKEITARNCGTLKCTDEVSGPIAIPSIGLEIYSY